MLQRAISSAVPAFAIDFTHNKSDILSRSRHFAVLPLVDWAFAKGIHPTFLAFCHRFHWRIWHFAISFHHRQFRHFAIEFHLQEFLHEFVNSRLARPAQQKRVCHLATTYLDCRLWLWVDCRVYRVPLCSCI